MLQNLRLAMHRQIRRHSARRSNSSSSPQHLGHIWTRLFHGGGRARGPDSLLDLAGPTQVTLGLQSYRTVCAHGHQSPGSGGGLEHEVDAVGLPGCLSSMDLQSCSPESPASPLSLQSELEPSPVSRDSSRASQSEPSTPVQSDFSAHSGPALTPQDVSVPPHNPRASRKLVLELAVNLKGVSLRRYSSLGPLSPVSPTSQTSTGHPHSEGLEVASPPEPSSSSVKAEGNDRHMEVPSREIRSRNEKRRKRRKEDKTGLCRISRTFNDEGGESGRETTPC